MIYIFIIAIIIYFWLDYYKYSKCEYKNESGNSYIKTRFNTGNYGEYLTFVELSKIDGKKKILTNIYIPKSDGKTTEIDLLLIHRSGIYVIESKNYSGWIYGNEKNKYWTQTLKKGGKNRFFNPIWQNSGHINALKNQLNDKYTNILKSVIVFSNRCEFKKITLQSEEILVAKRNRLVRNMNKKINNCEFKLQEGEIQQLYTNLSRYSNVGESVKTEHIKNIKNRLS